MGDFQARYYCKYLSGAMELPTKEEMRLDTEKEMNKRWEKGYSKKKAHMMGPNQPEYYKELATAAGTAPIEPVIIKLRDESVKRRYEDLLHFREDRYKIVSSDSFIKVQWFKGLVSLLYIFCIYLIKDNKVF